MASILLGSSHPLVTSATRIPTSTASAMMRSTSGFESGSPPWMPRYLIRRRLNKGKPRASALRSIQWRFCPALLSRVKPQKSHAALQASVTETSHTAGSRRMLGFLINIAPTMHPVILGCYRAGGSRAYLYLLP